MVSLQVLRKRRRRKGEISSPGRGEGLKLAWGSGQLLPPRIGLRNPEEARPWGSHTLHPTVGLCYGYSRKKSP